jgi:hypothetical protein
MTTVSGGVDIRVFPNFRQAFHFLVDKFRYGTVDAIITREDGRIVYEEVRGYRREEENLCWREYGF